MEANKVSRAKLINFSIVMVFTVILILAVFLTAIEVKNLNNEVATLEFQNEILSKEIATKDELIGTLRNTISVQEKSLNQNRIKLMESANQLTQAYSYIESLNLELKKEQTRKVPENYYEDQNFSYANTIQGLSEYLTYGFELPTAYNLHVFDCSESSAYLEWCLEKRGFDAQIVIGQAPFDTTTYHAWVIVKTKDGFNVAIEATSLTNGFEKWIDRFSSLFDNVSRGIVYYDESNPISYKYYNGYEASFNDIYEAIDSTNLEEWNWWVGVWGLN